MLTVVLEVLLAVVAAWHLAFGSVRTVASSWKFFYECVCSVWWPDSWKCTSYRCGHGSVEVYTYPCLGSFTYHRGCLVVRNIGGVLPVPTVVVTVLGSVPAVV